MPTPLEICLEDLDLDPEDERYLRCVALPGGEPGLALDREGVVRWMPEDPAAYGLWISADDQLVLLRDAGAGPIVVERGGRSLEAPAEKPVVLLHGDLLRINGRRLQVHVHGEAEEVHPPEALSGSALGRMARAAGMALALGATVGVGGSAAAQPGTADGQGVAPIEVRARPPAPRPRPTRPVDCKVTKVATTKDKQWPVAIHATCPAKEKLTVNSWGHLLDAKGKPIPGVSVKITQVKGPKIVTAAQSKPKVKPAQIRFFVPKAPLGL